MSDLLVAMWSAGYLASIFLYAYGATWHIAAPNWVRAFAAEFDLVAPFVFLADLGVRVATDSDTALTWASHVMLVGYWLWVRRDGDDDDDRWRRRRRRAAGKVRELAGRLVVAPAGDAR